MSSGRQAHYLGLAFAMMAMCLWADADEAPRKDCSGKAICVMGQWRTADEGFRELVFSAENLTDFPITVTLNLRSAAFAGEPPADQVKTIAPKTTDVLSVVLRAAQEQTVPTYRYKYDWNYGVANVEHSDDYLYRLPYASGKAYRVLQGYGSRFSHTGNEHYSVDFDMPRGTPVHAARDGTVMEVVQHHGEGCWEARCRRTANYINVLHDDGSTGEYYHLLRGGAQVAVGEKVTRGQFIALSGNSGHSTMPHLHFGVYEAIAWGRTRSLAVRFDSADGVIVTPRARKRYRAAE